MRKIILLALLITGFNCFSQPIKQYIGSNRTMIISKGTLKADSGFYVTVRDTLNHPYRDSIGLLTFRPQDKKLYISDGAKFILVSGIQIEDLPVYTASQGVELIDNDFRLFDNGAGAGTRFQWSPSKSAFRAGLAIGDEWDNSNIGNYSFATLAAN